MNEMVEIIAETEGIKTPTKKRTRKDVEKAYNEFTEKRAAKKAARKAKTPKTTTDKAPKAKTGVTPASTPKKTAEAKPRTAPAALPERPIKLNFISPTGFVREAGFDPKTKMFYVAFAKSTWAMPSDKKEWDAFEKAVADTNVDTDAYYRKMARGRAATMVSVKHVEVTA